MDRKAMIDERNAHVASVKNRETARLTTMVLRPILAPRSTFTEGSSTWEIYPATWDDVNGNWEKKIQWPPNHMDQGPWHRVRTGDLIKFLSGPAKSIRVSFDDGRSPFGAGFAKSLEVPNDGPDDYGVEGPFEVGNTPGIFTYLVQTMGEGSVDSRGLIFVDRRWIPWLSRSGSGR